LENLISSILAAMSTQLNDLKSDKITIPISDVKRWENNNLLLTKDLDEKKQKLLNLESIIISKDQAIIKLVYIDVMRKINYFKMNIII